MATENESQNIDLKAVLKRTLKNKWRLLIIFVIAFALSCAIIFPVPRYYTSSVELAPELSSQIGGGGISDLASSMGINLNNGSSIDAISPELYPDLLKSNNFVINLIGCRVKSNDGKIDTTYYDYLKKYQKSSIWAKAIGAVKKIFSSKKKTDNQPTNGKINPFKLTKEQDDIFGQIKSKINCSIDKRTSTITITVTDQDPLIAATMVNAATHQLQDFITRYRTSKARKDLEYYKMLTKKAKSQYEKSRRLYGSYSDANTDVLLESVRSKQEDLENDMQLKFNTYSSLNTQLQAAYAKLQERTPVFTVLRSASVPILPAGPKRMMFVIGFTFIAILGSIIYFSRDLIF